MTLSILTLLGSYLIGCFPTGMLVAKFYGINLSSQGSGNTGATNVARVIGKSAGILTLIIDIFKGLAVPLLAQALGNSFDIIAWSGFMAVAGHCFSIPRILKGGKGVASSIGAILILNLTLGLSAIVVFAAVFFYSKIVSLSSILAALWIVGSSIFLANTSNPAYFALAAIGVLVITRHKANLQRLRQGQEPRFTSRK